MQMQMGKCIFKQLCNLTGIFYNNNNMNRSYDFKEQLQMWKSLHSNHQNTQLLFAIFIRFPLALVLELRIKMRIWFKSRLINAITNDYLLKCLYYLWTKNSLFSRVWVRALTPHIDLMMKQTQSKFSTTEKIERINDEIKNDSEFMINTHAVIQCALPFISSKCTAKGEEHAFLMIYTHKHTQRISS